MEGRKGSLIRSLRFKLCLFLCATGVIFTGVMCVRSYYSSLSAAGTYMDAELSQIASVIVDYRFLNPGRLQGQMRLGMPKHPSLMPRRGMRDSGSFGPVPSLADLFTRHQKIMIAPLLSGPDAQFFLPPDAEDGFYTLLIHDERVRAYVATARNGTRFVVARPVGLFEDMARRALVSEFLEFAFFILLFVPVAVFVSTLTFSGVRRLAKQIYSRRESDLSPLTGPVPSELDPLIGSLNRLFKRTFESIQNERRFIADAAHEMRTPLTALSLKAQNFDTRGLSESQSQKLEGLKTAIKKQQELTEGLLTLARSQSRAPEAPERVNVKELFVEIIESLGDLADAHDLDLGIEELEVEELSAPRQELKTVLMNLCANAVKYTPEGGQIDLISKRAPESVVLTVADTGPGIPEAELKKVFEPFYRVGGDTAKIQGTGLGLAIVRQCADNMGARVEFKNRSPHGLEASIILRG